MLGQIFLKVNQKTSFLNSNLIYLKNVDYESSLDELDALVEKLEKEKTIIKSVVSWHKDYKVTLLMLNISRVKFVIFFHQKYLKDYPQISNNETDFQWKLSQFLHSPQGVQYKTRFLFDGELKCGVPAPRVLVSVINYEHVILESASYWVPAMDW